MAKKDVIRIVIALKTLGIDANTLFSRLCDLIEKDQFLEARKELEFVDLLIKAL